MDPEYSGYLSLLGGERPRCSSLSFCQFAKADAHCIAQGSERHGEGGEGGAAHGQPQRGLQLQALWISSCGSLFLEFFNREKFRTAFNSLVDRPTQLICVSDIYLSNDKYI